MHGHTPCHNCPKHGQRSGMLDRHQTAVDLTLECLACRFPSKHPLRRPPEPLPRCPPRFPQRWQRQPANTLLGYRQSCPPRPRQRRVSLDNCQQTVMNALYAFTCQQSLVPTYAERRLTSLLTWPSAAGADQGAHEGPHESAHEAPYESEHGRSPHEPPRAADQGAHQGANKGGLCTRTCCAAQC
jgi:hypothetical protein